MNKAVKIIFIALMLAIFCSCWNIKTTPIGFIKNDTNHDIVAADWSEEMSDSLLYNDKIYMEYYIQPKLTETIGTRHNSLSGQPDSVKEHIYVFYPDSIDKYRKLKIEKGIFKNSFLKKIEIQVNKIKAPLDTVYIK